ncbi:MAG: hypothetical protein WC554_06375 [Clostridia bacterium]
MAKNKLEGRQAEVEALKGIPGIEVGDILNQIAAASGEEITKPPEQQQGGAQNSPEGKAAETTKPGEAGSAPDATGILKEIFGDRFTSVDDLKKNIPVILREHDELRQQNQTLLAEKNDLTGKLSVKPKNNFANDDVALFNEFVRTTGVKSFDVFNRLNSTDLANVDPMEAIVLERLMETPELIAKEAQLRKHVENTYNVNPEQVTEEELEINKIGLAREGRQAKLRLQELKGKLKIPEQDQSTSPEEKQWTPEQVSQGKTIWDVANKAMGEKLSKVPIYFPDTKEPFINFVIPEEKQKEVHDMALNFAVSNQMEPTEKNLEIVAKMMYSEHLIRNLGLIAHSIFEKARTMTEEEKLKFYSNPSKLGGDTAPIQRGGAEEDDPEVQKNKIFEAEKGRM